MSNMGKFTALLSMMVMGLQLGCQPAPVLAQMNQNDYANYDDEVRNNTVCSFINADGVNVRPNPNKNDQPIATLNTGDGVRVVSSGTIDSNGGKWIRITARVYGYVPNERFVPLQGWVFNQYINGCSEDQFDRWRR